jgi:hypothetical protein
MVLFFLYLTPKSTIMMKIDIHSSSLWNSILVVSVIFTAFVLPVLPLEWQGILFRLAYSVVYISAIFSLNKRSKTILFIFFATLFLEWFSSLFNLEWLHIISKSTNILFFLIIVFSLIMQIAKSKEVKAVAILGSIAGYLLLGLVYSIFISIIIKNDPAAYSNMPVDLQPGTNDTASFSLYYSFVTIASLGYGDICPLKPYTRSLATFITVSGQFYIAVIVALLVGKFSSQQDSK